MNHSIPSPGGIPRRSVHGRRTARPVSGRGLALILLLFFLPGWPLMAQAPADLERLVDEQFAAANLERWHVPGAVLVVVQDGTVRLIRGYGVADLHSRRPVEPMRTLFRAGSVSKAFTAAAAIRLSEQGRLSLDIDVNEYLRRVRLEDTCPAPVTLRHLLTHTAGLAEYIHGQHPRAAADWLPLAEYLARRLPPRVRPPGELFSYNDHGYSLAGLVVQDVAGIPYEDYMEREILAPLGMSRSTFSQRPAGSLLGDLAVGYRFTDNRYVAYSLDYCQTVPAAGLYTTAGDMARFMMALLDGVRGDDGDAQILSAAGVDRMFQRAFAHHPALRGRTLGLSEMFTDGRHVLFHDGAMPGFNSRMCLVPGQRCGFFLAWNSDSLAPKFRLTNVFMDVFCPAPPPDPSPPAVSVDLAPYAGRYAEVAGLDGTALEIGGLLQNTIPVAATPAGTLQAMGGEFRPVAPPLFRNAAGDPIAFGPGQDPEMDYLFVGTAAFRRLSFWETPDFLIGLSIFLLLVCLPMALLWAGHGWISPGKLGAFWQRTFPDGRNLAGLASLLIVLFLGGFVFLFLQMGHYWQIMRDEYPWSWITKLLVVPLVIGVVSIPLPVYAVRAWLRRQGTPFGRVCLSLVAAAAALFIWVMAAWNLLGFQY